MAAYANKSYVCLFVNKNMRLFTALILFFEGNSRDREIVQVIVLRENRFSLAGFCKSENALDSQKCFITSYIVGW